MKKKRKKRKTNVRQMGGKLIPQLWQLKTHGQSYFLHFVMWCITLIDLWMLSHPCIPGINPTWLWFMILLMSYWIQFASVLLRIFASMFIRNVGLWFSYSVLVWFWCQGNAGLVKWVWKCSLLFCFLEGSEKDWHYSFKYLVENSPLEPSVSRLYWEVFD